LETILQDPHSAASQPRATALPAAPAASIPATSQLPVAAPLANRPVTTFAAPQPSAPTAQVAQMSAKPAFPAPFVGKPTVAPAAMPPPAPHLPWVEVAGGRRRTSSKHSTPSDPDAFLNLRISKLRHHNVAFPRQNDVYALACKICTYLGPLNTATYTLREALSLANSDQLLLHDDIVQVILHLSDLMRQASVR